MASTSRPLLAAFIVYVSFIALVQGQINAKINHPRPPILQSAADDDGHAATSGPVQTAEKDSRLDPSNFLVVLIAAIILIYSSNRALRPPYMDMSVASEEVAAYNEAAEAGMIKWFLLSSCSPGHDDRIFRRDAAPHDFHVCYCIICVFDAHILLHVRL